MAERKVTVLAHGHCFDGLASAALFTHLRRSIDKPAGLSFDYRSCGYSPNLKAIPEGWLNGDENAIVDFRFSPSARLSWYFDHHLTAFASEAERQLALDRPDRCFYDAGYGSCTKLIADVGRSRFDVSFDGFAELIAWADRVDAATFESAQEAIDGSHPIMQLAGAVEQHGGADLLRQLVPRLLGEPLADVARSEAVQQLWGPVEQARRHTRERISSCSKLLGRVVFTDLHEAPLGTSGKFIAYALYPQCTYSVALVRMKHHFKISVGYNPWCDQPRHHDIARLCQQRGGGGHAVVGAVSVPLSDLDKARQLASALVDELNR